MLSWLIPALLAPLFWAISNLFDQQLIQKQHKAPETLLVFTGFVAAAAGFIAAIYNGNSLHFTPLTLGLGVASGLIGLFAFLPYFEAIRDIEASTAVLMWNASTVFVAVLAYFTLHEILPLQSYIALGLIFTSSILATVGNVRGRLTKRALGWMLLACFFIALEKITQKAVFQEIDYASGLWTFGIGNLLGTLSLLTLPRVRQDLNRMAKKDITYIFKNELIDIGGVLASSLAVSLGPVTLVEAVDGLQPLFILGLAYLAQRFYLTKKPTQKEQISDKRRIPTEAIAALLAIVGIFFLKGN